MPDEQNQNPTVDKTEGGEKFTPITSQDELNKIIGERVKREQAKYADYDDLKTRAAKLADIEDSQKSELQRERDAREAAEAKLQTAERSVVQSRIAAEMGVPIELLHGDDEDQMKASAQRVIQWRDSNTKTPPPPKSLKSGSVGDGSDSGGSRAAAAIRQMRGAH